jgi:hypothetical protein
MCHAVQGLHKNITNHFLVKKKTHQTQPHVFFVSSSRLSPASGFRPKISGSFHWGLWGLWGLCFVGIVP